MRMLSPRGSLRISEGLWAVCVVSSVEDWLDGLHGIGSYKTPSGIRCDGRRVRKAEVCITTNAVNGDSGMCSQPFGHSPIVKVACKLHGLSCGGGCQFPGSTLETQGYRVDAGLVFVVEQIIVGQPGHFQG